MFSETRRAAFLAIFGAGHIAGAAEAASPMTVHDCDALKNSQGPFVLTLRNDAMTFVRGDDTTTTTPSLSRMRVLRGDDGRVTTFLLPDREGQAPIVSEKRYWRTLASTSSEGVRTVLAHELPPTGDPVAVRADFTEIYTRSVPGKPPLRQRMDAVFVGEGEIELGPCRFRTHRYRTALRAEPSPDGKPFSVSDVDFAPDLMVPVRSASHHEVQGLSATQGRTAIGIERE